MRKSLFALAAIAAMTASCQLADVSAPGKGSDMFYGTIENETRTVLSQDGDLYHVIWQLADPVYFTDGLEDGNYGYYYAQEGGTGASWFKKKAGSEYAPTGLVKAYYPANVKDILSYEQNYVENGVAVNPMYAEAVIDETAETPAPFVFKNICGILKFNITSSVGAVAKKITITADQGLSGHYTVVDNAAVVEGKNGVSMSFGSAGLALGTEAKPVLIVVPAGTYTGMKITLSTVDGKTQTISMKDGASIKVDRSMVSEGDIAFNNLTDVPTGTTAILPPGAIFNLCVRGTDMTKVDVTDIVALRNLATVDDYDVTGVIFDVNSSSTEGLRIEDVNSALPIYMVRDVTTGVVTISTPAATFSTGEDPSYMFRNLLCLRFISNLDKLDTSAAKDMTFMFGSYITNADSVCFALESLDLSNFNTENVEDMTNMFRNLRMVKHLDLSSFNTSKVKSFRSTFYYANHIEELDLSNFDFSADTSLCSTFYCMERCKAIHFPEVVDCSNVEDMRYLFHNCASLTKLDLTCFKNTENCNDMGYLCYDCGSLQEVDLSTIDFSLDTSMSYMFAYDTSLVNIKWADEVDCSNVQTMNYMFRQTHYSTYDLSNLKNIGALTGCKYMFAYCPYLTKVIFDRDADFSALGNPGYMFYHSSEGLTVDLNDWDVSSMIYLNYMFYGCWARELDITSWDTSNVADFYYLFYNMRNCGTFRFGNDFVGPSHTRSTCFMSGASNKTGSSSASEQTGINVGSIKIYCGTDALDFIASRATVKYINDGYYNGTPCPVTFYDYKTGMQLTPANW